MIAMYNRGEEANALFSYGRDWILVTKVEIYCLRNLAKARLYSQTTPSLKLRFAYLAGVRFP